MSAIEYVHDKSEPKLQSAILIYSTGYNSSCTLATYHDVKNWVIMPGRPLDNATVEYLFKHGGRHSSGFIPPEILEIGPGRLAWFAKSRINPIFFSTSNRSSDGKLNRYNTLRIRWPNLIFIAAGDGLNCYAVKSSSRPTLKSRIYKAPFFNMFSGGGVCLPGTANISGALRKPAKQAMEQIEEIFYSSSFSHIGRNGKVVGYPGGCAAFWAWYCEKSKSQPTAKFPNQVLVPSAKYNNLGDLLR